MGRPEPKKNQFGKALQEAKSRFERERMKFDEAMGEAKKLFEEKSSLTESITKLLDTDEQTLKSRSNGLTEFLFGKPDDLETGLNNLKKKFEQAKQLKELYKDDPEKQSLALALFESEYDKNDKNKKKDDGLVGDLVGDAKTELSKGLGNMLTDFDNFGNNFKKMGQNLANSMIQTAADALIKVIINEQTAAMAIQAIRATWNVISAAMGMPFGMMGANPVGDFGGLGGGLVSAVCHSGGVVPKGTNFTLPGTNEQLALLKGGERVLSPGENASYNSNSQGGGQPVVFNNFNVKAWDSKDVSKYLLENKDLLNAITYEGIKYNNGHLRTMVSNA